jgi:hypothetical protein
VLVLESRAASTLTTSANENSAPTAFRPLSGHPDAVAR